MHHMRIAFDEHQIFDAHRSVFADPAQIVAPEIHQHDVFGALFLVGCQFLRKALVFGVVRAARPSSRDRPVRRLRVPESSPAFPETIRRSSASGIFRKYMYGEGFTIRSAR